MCREWPSEEYSAFVEEARAAGDKLSDKNVLNNNETNELMQYFIVILCQQSRVIPFIQNKVFIRRIYPEGWDRPYFMHHGVNERNHDLVLFAYYEDEYTCIEFLTIDSKKDHVLYKIAKKVLDIANEKDSDYIFFDSQTGLSFNDSQFRKFVLRAHGTRIGEYMTRKLFANENFQGPIPNIKWFMK